LITELLTEFLPMYRICKCLYVCGMLDIVMVDVADASVVDHRAS
jgi:hypothetical protein